MEACPVKGPTRTAKVRTVIDAQLKEGGGMLDPRRIEMISVPLAKPGHNLEARVRILRPGKGEPDEQKAYYSTSIWALESEGMLGSK